MLVEHTTGQRRPIAGLQVGAKLLLSRSTGRWTECPWGSEAARSFNQAIRWTPGFEADGKVRALERPEDGLPRGIQRLARSNSRSMMNELIKVHPSKEKPRFRRGF
jgi:hypothetical protein